MFDSVVMMGWMLLDWLSVRLSSRLFYMNVVCRMKIVISVFDVIGR